MQPPLALETTSRSPSWVRWQIVALLMIFTGLNHFHRQSLPAVVETVMRDCHFVETDMSWVYFAFLLGYVLFMVVGGWFSDRYGAWLALVVSGFGTSAMLAATGLCGFLTSSRWIFLSLLVVRFVMGTLTTPLFPAAGRIVAAWIPFQTRGWANGLVLGATTIGVSLAPLVFGRLADEVEWRNACIVMGAVTALITLVWFFQGRNYPHEHQRVNNAELALTLRDIGPVRQAGGGGRELLKLLSNPSLIFLTINYAAVGYYSYTLFYWMKHYFEVVRRYPENVSRADTAIVTSAMIVAMPLGGILSDALVRRFGYYRGRAAVPIFGMLASAVLLYSATLATSHLQVVTLFYLAHFAIGLCETPTWLAGLELGGKHCGTAAAIVNTGGNLGGLLAPVVTAYVAKAYSWNTGFTIASVVCLIGVVQWFGIRLKAPDAD